MQFLQSFSDHFRIQNNSKFSSRVNVQGAKITMKPYMGLYLVVY